MCYHSVAPTFGLKVSTNFVSKMTMVNYFFIFAKAFKHTICSSDRGQFLGWLCIHHTLYSLIFVAIHDKGQLFIISKPVIFKVCGFVAEQEHVI